MSSSITRRGSTVRTRIMLPIVMVLVLTVTSALAAVEATVDLGTAESFAVLAGETITNTGATTITGDVGLHPGTDTPGFGTVTLVPPSALHVDNATALSAKNALLAAITDAQGRLSSTIGPELGGQTLVGGAYNSDSGAFELTTGILTLDGEDNADAVFIFQSGSSLLATGGGSIVFTRGAQACNVFWVVGSSATIEPGTAFFGSILAETSIFLQTGATIVGRAFASTGEVTMDTNTITRATCLPEGPIDTGTGSTSGIENLRLLILGGVLLAGAVGVLFLRPRSSLKGVSS